MKKILIQTLILFFGLQALPASSLCAQTLDALFVRAPKSLLPVVDEAARLDLIDLYNHGLEAKVENTFGGQSEITKKSSTYLALKTTDVSTWQLHLLPCAKDTLLLSLHTLVAGSHSTDVRIFTRKWHIVKDKLPAPRFEQFLRPDSRLYAYEKQYLNAVLTEQPYCVTLVPESTDLIYQISTSGLCMEDRNKAEQYLMTLIYEWKDGRYVQKK